MLTTAGETLSTTSTMSLRREGSGAAAATACAPIASRITRARFTSAETVVRSVFIPANKKPRSRGAMKHEEQTAAGSAALDVDGLLRPPGRGLAGDLDLLRLRILALGHLDFEQPAVESCTDVFAVHVVREREGPDEL